MISREFIEFCSAKVGIERLELLEKDILLQQILFELSKNEYFLKNFVFKGGTCLTKCYLGYYRFSEDLDFSWMHQHVLNTTSEKKRRRILSEEINTILVLFEDISKNLSLEFKSDKKDQNYVEFGGRNKFVTLKLWYTSNILKQRSFIKVQINFVELFFYTFKKRSVKTILGDVPMDDIMYLFPQEAEFLMTNISITCYDLKEILLEKFRAIITRRGLKGRDIIDVYFILREMKKSVEVFEKRIVEKVRFMLKYEKYRLNMKEKERVLQDFSPDEAKYLLLKTPESDFEKTTEEIIVFTNKLLKDLQDKTEHVRL